jgi:starvation-inducible DNA-binding protein
LEAHEIILEEARGFAEDASNGGDEGTNDLPTSNVVRTNEIQAWFISEHVVDLPLAKADWNQRAKQKMGSPEGLPSLRKQSKS